MVNSRVKGAKFERQVAKLLTDLFKVKFERVPMSGAYSTTHHTRNPVFKGDVFTEDEAFNKKYNVVIECKRIKKLPKHDKDWNLLLLSKVKKWLEQCVRESGGKNFWLFIKEDYKPIMIIEGLLLDDHYDYSSPMIIEEFKELVKNGVL